MPYKFNQAGRHKIPKSKYRVTNWPEYDAALLRRASLTLWFTDEAVAACRSLLQRLSLSLWPYRFCFARQTNKPPST